MTQQLQDAGTSAARMEQAASRRENLLKDEIKDLQKVFSIPITLSKRLQSNTFSKMKARYRDLNSCVQNFPIFEIFIFNCFQTAQHVRYQTDYTEHCHGKQN